MTSEDKKKQLEQITKELEKSLKAATFFLTEEATVANPNDIISTGSISVDKALGIGGFKRGRIFEIYGPESTSKTTMALEAIANAHAGNPESLACFIDAEHSFDPLYASAIGVDLERLAVFQPDYAEQALNYMDALSSSELVDIIVLDSVAALVPKAELEGNIEDIQVGLQARLLSKTMRKILGNCYKSETMIIFINQERSTIARMGPQKTTAGGLALRYYASFRIELKRMGEDKKGEDAIGLKVKATIKKNKLAPPMRSAEFIVSYGIGIDKAREFLHLCIEDKLIKKSGAWFKLEDGSTLAQGEDNATKALLENEELARGFYEQIMEKRNLPCNFEGLVSKYKRAAAKEAAKEETEEDVIDPETGEVLE